MLRAHRCPTIHAQNLATRLGRRGILRQVLMGCLASTLLAGPLVAEEVPQESPASPTPLVETSDLPETSKLPEVRHESDVYEPPPSPLRIVAVGVGLDLLKGAAITGSILGGSRLLQEMPFARPSSRKPKTVFNKEGKFSMKRVEKNAGRCLDKAKQEALINDIGDSHVPLSGGDYALAMLIGTLAYPVGKLCIVYPMKMLYRYIRKKIASRKGSEIEHEPANLAQETSPAG